MTRRAIILAAGKGLRLLPLTSTVPKCLAVVGGRTILENALIQLRSVGVEEVVLVVGHLKERIMEKFGPEHQG